MVLTAPMADITTRLTLSELAPKLFDKLSDAEQNLLAATAKGEDVDCNILAEEDRIIRGNLLSWLCTDPDASAYVTRSGISIVGARIDGEVSLKSVKIAFPLKASKCVFADTIVLEGSQMVSLSLADTEVEYLRAKSLVVEQSIDLRGSKVNGSVNLSRAKIGGDLRCDSGHFIGDGKQQALDFIGATIQGTVYLDGFEAKGGVALTEATIGGDLLSHSGKFIGRDTVPACNASRAKIDGSVLLCEGFEAKGEVLFWGASIGGDLMCSTCLFYANDSIPPLNFSRAKIQGSAFLCDGFKAKGGVVLRAATIGGDLLCDEGRFLSGNQGAALDATGASIEGRVYFRGMIAEGLVRFRSTSVRGNFEWIGVASPENVALDLQNAKVGTLVNHRKSWPREGNLLLFGLAYDDIDERASLDERVSLDNQLLWIRLQGSGSFSPQPYERLSAFFRTMGREEDAVKVMIAQNEDHAGHTKGVQELVWYRFIGKAIGYGYRRGRPFLISLIVIGIGWLVFLAGYHNGLITPTDEKAYVLGKNGKRHLSEFYPKFDSLVYSVESFVPLVKLGMSDSWTPNANRGESLRLGSVSFRTGSLLRYYLWFHVILGWVLSALWVGGIAGVVKS